DLYRIKQCGVCHVLIIVPTRTGAETRCRPGVRGAAIIAQRALLPCADPGPMSSRSNPASPAPWWLRALARLPVPVFRAAGWVMAAGLLLLAPRRRRVVMRNLAL
ncbi:hypothetical protein RZS08_04255, partial [Arthrospira platensis SPKY1]|nr:hypothetical protein [Arthrospira platensis SPKY1]